MRKIYLTLAAVSLTGLLASVSYAAAPSALGVGEGGVNTLQYHSYDGLICTDCHTLHNSEDGAVVATHKTATGPAINLLKKGDVTDMCLSCHKQGNNTSANADLPGGVVNSGWTAPIVMTTDGVDPVGIAMPAGDFYYSNLDDSKGHNPAYSHGSAVATSVMMSADTTLDKTPPGNAAGALTDEWSCHSCHGMHNRFSNTYSAWRQIKRKVNGIIHTGCDQTATIGDVETSPCDTTKVDVTAAGFEAIQSNSRGNVNGVVYSNLRGDGKALEGADLYADESDTNKNVYRGGFSSFCSTCHGDFHGGNDSSKALQNTNVMDADGHWLRHPTNLSLSDPDIKSKYGTAGYTKAVTNDTPSNPNPAGYDWKYPLIQPTGDFTVSVTGAADALVADVRLSCLTCHKAHASQFENMTRWDTNAHAFIADGETDFTGAVSNGDNPVYGCGKCHQKGGAAAYVKNF
jgi:predicted CXXCH cytochrome family protein